VQSKLSKRYPKASFAVSAQTNYVLGTPGSSSLLTVSYQGDEELSDSDRAAMAVLVCDTLDSLGAGYDGVEIVTVHQAKFAGLFPLPASNGNVLSGACTWWHSQQF
jgi:hypothetical protein